MPSIDTPLHISEATKEERLKWATEICMYWENISTYLDVNTKIKTNWPTTLAFGSLRQQATFMAEYLAEQPGITLDMILKINTKVCPGYCTELPLMMANIRKRREADLKKKPTPSAETATV